MSGRWRIVPSLDETGAWDVIVPPMAHENDDVPEIIHTGTLDECRAEYPGAIVDRSAP